MEDNDEDDVSAEEDSEDEEEGEANDQFETESVAMTEDFTDYDAKHVNFAAEVDELERIKAAREEELFPDEVDTPMDQAARQVFIRNFKVYQYFNQFKLNRSIFQTPCGFIVGKTATFLT